MVLHLIVVGACYLDTVLTVPHYPAEDEKLRAETISRRRGGNGPNTLEVLSQLLTTAPPSIANETTHLHLISTFPSHSSPAVATIAASLGHNVSIAHSIYREDHAEPASSYIIRSRASGSRTIVNYNGLPEMTVGEFVEAVHGVRAGYGGASSAGEGEGGGDHGFWVHFEGRIPDVTLECIRHARGVVPGVKISVEVEKPGRAGLEELAREAGVVFYSRSWAVAEGYGDAESCVRGQAERTTAPVSVCTWGEGPAALWDAEAERLYTSDAVDVPAEQIADTIGAGDTFIAGMLYGLLKSQDGRPDYQHIVSFATRLAGMKVQRDGFDGLGRDVLQSHGLQ